MSQAVQLFGYLVLTFLGFVIPILGFLLSMFNEGMSKLKAQYENERAQSEEKLKSQLQQKSASQAINNKDIKEIQQTIDELKNAQKKAIKKISYLQPRGILIKVFIPLIVSFLAIETILLSFPTDSLKTPQSLCFFRFLLIVSVLSFFFRSNECRDWSCF